MNELTKILIENPFGNPWETNINHHYDTNKCIKASNRVRNSRQFECCGDDYGPNTYFNARTRECCKETEGFIVRPVGSCGKPLNV